MVTPRGFIAPTFEETRLVIVEKWKREFGQNAASPSDVLDGLIIDLITWFLTINYEAIEEAYNSHNFGTASGLNLDAVLQLFGTLRLQPQGSIATIWLYGDAATVVPSLSTMTTLDRGDAFELNDPATIVATSTYVITVGDAIGTPTTITVTIGIEATPIVISGGTATDVRDLVVTTLLSNTNVDSVVSGGEEPNGDGIVHVTMTGILTHSIISSAGTEVDDHEAVEALATSTINGQVPANAASLTRIGSPLTGWQGVTNIIDATLGRGDESDASYRIRHQAEVEGLGRATIRSLRAALNDQKRVPGVEVATVHMNTGNVPDALGRPPHSFESVVLGGLGDDIVKTIYEFHTTGTQSFGLTSKLVQDDRESPPIQRRIFYTVGIEKFIWGSIDITPGEGFPTTATADIRDAVATAIAIFGDGLGIARDVQLEEMKGIVNKEIPGIKLISVSIGSTASPAGPTPPLTSVDIIITQREISRWDAGRIEVTIL